MRDLPKPLPMPKYEFQKPVLGTFSVSYKAPVGVVLSLLLTACGHTPEPRIEIREVRVVVPVPCDPDPRPAKPVLPDHTSAPDIFEGVKRLLARDRLREAYEGELEAALSGCAGA